VGDCERVGDAVTAEGEADGGKAPVGHKKRAVPTY
jgi:hypothetical protein